MERPQIRRDLESTKCGPTTEFLLAIVGTPPEMLNISGVPPLRHRSEPAMFCSSDEKWSIRNLGVWPIRSLYGSAHNRLSPY
jgi:hypothetical protein